MSDSRKRLSGSGYRKRAKERQKNEQEILNKIPKLHHFFPGNTEINPTENLDTNQLNHKTMVINGPTFPACPNSEIGQCEFSVIPAANSKASTSKNPIPDSGVSNGVCIDDEDFSSLNSELPFTNANTESTSDSSQHTVPIPNSYSHLKVSDDPAEWVIDEMTRDILLKRGIAQNINSDFSLTKRTYADRVRYLSQAVFTRTLPNGETQPRPWLVYSRIKLALFCGPCKLFGKTSLLTEGYSDWKNVHQRLKEHENSFEHKSANTDLLNRSQISARIDKALVIEAEKAIDYWRNILKRVVTVIKSLAVRGLPFRSSSEKFYSIHNGNYLMCLELIAEFDPFLAEHIRLYGNKGSGSTSYLSFTICEEFIQLMAKQVQNEILEQVKAAKYFSISVDSTPDISHIDQLTFIIRYVNNEGCPKERFLQFIPNSGHKAKELSTCVLNTLKDHDIDVMNCRGQSYDNASNMSGTYAGLQALIKEVNPLAEYVPCAAHSLNLVGKNAAECCPEAVNFFAILQQLYNFFTASTHRWEILLKYMKSNTNVVKNLCITRWSARHDACKSLCQSRNEIIYALQEIGQDINEKPATRSEALGIFDSLNNLEINIILLFWNDVLNRFHSVNNILQSVNIDLTVAVEMYQALIQFIINMRDIFDTYEKNAVDRWGTDVYRYDISRRRKRKVQFDEQSNESSCALTGREYFRINVFYLILDRLRTELEKRAAAYVKLNDKFGFITKLLTMQPEAIVESSQNLQSHYPDDLEDTLSIEFLHLGAYLTSLSIESYTGSQLYSMLVEKNLWTVYPNIHIALRIFLCIAATNCSGERSFSTLRRVKNYLRSTISQSRLNALTLLTIEAELTNKLNYNVIIDEFACTKVRRVQL